jgi:hypothetical protein
MGGSDHEGRLGDESRGVLQEEEGGQVTDEGGRQGLRRVLLFFVSCRICCMGGWLIGRKAGIAMGD